MDTTITMHSIRATLTHDKHGPFVMLEDTDNLSGDDSSVGMHPMQLRYIAERFAGLEPQPKPQHFGDLAAALAHRLRVLGEHIENLHTALLASRASEYTDMSRELADAGALLTIARAFTFDLPEEAPPDPAEQPQEAEATTTAAPATTRAPKPSAAPAAAPAGQMGLDV